LFCPTHPTQLVKKPRLCVLNLAGWKEIKRIPLFLFNNTTKLLVSFSFLAVVEKFLQLHQKIVLPNSEAHMLMILENHKKSSIKNSQEFSFEGSHNVNQNLGQ